LLEAPVGGHLLEVLGAAGAPEEVPHVLQNRLQHQFTAGSDSSLRLRGGTHGQCVEEGPQAACVTTVLVAAPATPDPILQSEGNMFFLECSLFN